jgi:ABC-2 type transport system ATP-binding protein
MLTINHLTKTYGKTAAVSDISFQLVPGTLAGFLGPNGAGKTTTINMITGMLSPTSGEILYNGRTIGKNLKAWKMKFGAVCEYPLLFHKLTLFEHMILAGRLYQLSKKEATCRGEGLFEYLNLSEYRDIPADEASAGMKKKCALAIALIHTPDVLICDEVFNGIDPVSVSGIRTLFCELIKNKMIIFFSSHTLPVVESIARRILILVKGKIAKDFPVSVITDMDTSLESIFFQTLGNLAFHMSGLSWLV